MFSLRERFLGIPNPINGGYYAPMTIGAPQYTQAIDYKLFKQTKDEKIQAKLKKLNHKRKLMEYYPNGIGRNLNIPEKQVKVGKLTF